MMKRQYKTVDSVHPLQAVSMKVCVGCCEIIWGGGFPAQRYYVLPRVCFALLAMNSRSSFLNMWWSASKL